MIFGGCCSNIFILEKIITNNPESGNVVTFFQFLFIAIKGYVSFFDKGRPPFYIKKNQVPLKRWSWTIIMFFLISVLNNSVFMFKVSIPIHIIFRSSGTAIIMLIGYLFTKKRYNNIQVAGAVILTIGAIVTTLYKDTEMFAKRDRFHHTGLATIFEDFKLLIGIGILLFANILMALLGLYNEETYRRYGKHWKENFFYSHLFGLPFFIFMSRNVYNEFMTLWNYPEYFNILRFQLPKKTCYLFLNVLTQFFCVRDVNMLAGNTTTLTVSVVLLLRKFSSLLLSMYLFNNSLSLTGSFGAFLVFFGVFLYSYGSKKPKKVMNEQIPFNDIRNQLIEFSDLKPKKSNG